MAGPSTQNGWQHVVVTVAVAKSCGGHMCWSAGRVGVQRQMNICCSCDGPGSESESESDGECAAMGQWVVSGRQRSEEH